MPEAFTQKLSFMDRVSAWKRENYGENCEDASISRVCAHFKEIWEKKQALENQIKEECNVALRALSDIGIQIMDSENIDEAKVNGEAVWIVDKTRFSIPGKKDSPERIENEEKFLKWAEEHGVLEGLYTMSFRHQRMTGISREELREGRPLPDGIKMSPDKVLCVNKRQPGKAEHDEEE